jgi:hypothetical protein
MTTREIYFKGYMVSDKPQGMFYYTQIIKGLECLRTSGWFDMHQDWHERNIILMQELETQEGFKFWNISDDCDTWLEKKSREHQNLISALAFVQRDEPYKDLEDVDWNQNKI